jgi:hypothetical protein
MNLVSPLWKRKKSSRNKFNNEKKINIETITHLYDIENDIKHFLKQTLFINKNLFKQIPKRILQEAHKKS